MIVVRGENDISADDNAALLSELARACEEHPSGRVILDLSDTDYVPTGTEARALATAISELARPNHCQIAIVARPGAQYGVARMIEAITEVRDATASAFASFNEALGWVSP